MAAIKGRNTKPELLVRKALHARGLRYRLHPENLPGKPDLVFPRHRAIVLVHGCFWHGHDCELFRVPATRTEFWREKFKANRARDGATFALLHRMGWRVLTVWECAMRGSGKRSIEHLANEIAAWLLTAAPSAELKGQSHAYL